MNEIPYFYSNVMGILMSQNDFTIDFGYKIPEQVKLSFWRISRIRAIRARASEFKNRFRNVLLALPFLSPEMPSLSESPLDWARGGRSRVGD